MGDLKHKTRLWRDILSDALYTPSPHNTQPWRIRLTDERNAELLVEAGRTLPCGDSTGSFAALSMGMFLEALHLCAARFGQSLHCDYHHPLPFPNPAGVQENPLLPFAHLSLIPDGVTTDAETLALLRTRRTSRRADYFPDPIATNATLSLRTLAHDAGQTFLQTEDPVRIEPIIALNTDALIEDLNTHDYHAELVRWFRFSDPQAETARDGLSYRCMNTPRLLFAWTARFPHSLRIPLLRPLITRVYRKQLGVVPALGFLAGPFWRSHSEASDAGRFLLRFYLELARHQLFIHPFGNLITNSRAVAVIREFTQRPDTWFVFRLGYSPEPPASQRRMLQEILC